MSVSSSTVKQLGTFAAINAILNSLTSSTVTAAQSIRALADVFMHALDLTDRMLTMADNMVDDSNLQELTDFITKMEGLKADELAKENGNPDIVAGFDATIKVLSDQHGKAAIAYAKNLTKGREPFTSKYS